MRLAWLTDLHLNFVEPEARRHFYSTIRDAQLDAVLLGGDIAEAPTLVDDLRELERAIAFPIYFVLGNHDFYRGSFAAVHAAIQALQEPHLTWLTHSGVKLLSNSTALVGEDGWADGRLGDYQNSPIFLNDFLLINEFVGLDKSARLRLLNKLGDDAATRIRAKLKQACTLRPRVILLTHVPPFRESCWYDGAISDDNWLPHFTSKAVGDAIIEVMAEHPACKLQVLCGHTHGAGFAQIRANITVVTGGTEYGHPIIQNIVEV